MASLTKADAVAHSCLLLRDGRSAALSSALATHDGWPYASFVTYATDQNGCPIFLFSDLSDHARNLQKDNRASLLVERTSNRKHPQTGPRVTVVGKITKTKVPAHANRFFARHPRAKMYAGFGDFNFYRMSIERAHYVGGFAKAVWFRGRELLTPQQLAAEITDAEPEILEHMNTDHGEAIDLYAQHLLKRRGSGWQLTGVDAGGVDLVNTGRHARLHFEHPLESAGEIRKKLVALAAKARSSIQSK